MLESLGSFLDFIEKKPTDWAEKIVTKLLGRFQENHPFLALLIHLPFQLLFSIPLFIIGAPILFIIILFSSSKYVLRSIIKGVRGTGSFSPDSDGFGGD